MIQTAKLLDPNGQHEVGKRDKPVFDAKQRPIADEVACKERQLRDQKKPGQCERQDVTECRENKELIVSRGRTWHQCGTHSRRCLGTDDRCGTSGHDSDKGEDIHATDGIEGKKCLGSGHLGRRNVDEAGGQIRWVVRRTNVLEGRI